MPRYVALLRAINTGRRRVKMADLRTLFEALDVANVETFIASGNVIFDAATRGRKALEKRIEARLLDGLGYEVDTFLRTIPELTKVARLDPFDASELADAGNQVGVAFAGAPPSADALRKLKDLESERDEFRVDGREIYWLRRRALGDSKLTGAALERALGQPATVRGVPTVQRLVAKYA